MLASAQKFIFLKFCAVVASCRECIEVEVWNHIVVMVNDALYMEIYVNGVKTEGDFSGSGGALTYSDTSGSLGRHYRTPTAPVNYFKGALDEFRYWNRALTADEIVELHTAE